VTNEILASILLHLGDEAILRKEDLAYRKVSNISIKMLSHNI